MAPVNLNHVQFWQPPPKSSVRKESALTAPHNKYNSRYEGFMDAQKPVQCSDVDEEFPTIQEILHPTWQRPAVVEGRTQQQTEGRALDRSAGAYSLNEGTRDSPVVLDDDEEQRPEADCETSPDPTFEQATTSRCKTWYDVENEHHVDDHKRHLLTKDETFTTAQHLPLLVGNDKILQDISCGRTRSLQPITTSAGDEGEQPAPDPFPRLFGAGDVGERQDDSNIERDLSQAIDELEQPEQLQATVFAAQTGSDILHHFSFEQLQDQGNNSDRVGVHRSRSEGLQFSSPVETSRESKEGCIEQTWVEEVEEVLQLGAEEAATKVTERAEVQQEGEGLVEEFLSRAAEQDSSDGSEDELMREAEDWQFKAAEGDNSEDSVDEDYPCPNIDDDPRTAKQHKQPSLSDLDGSDDEDARPPKRRKRLLVSTADLCTPPLSSEGQGDDYRLQLSESPFPEVENGLAAEYREWPIACFLKRTRIGDDTSHTLEVNLPHIPESLTLAFPFHRSGDSDREASREDVVISDSYTPRYTKRLPRKRRAASSLGRDLTKEQKNLLVKLAVRENKTWVEIGRHFPGFTLQSLKENYEKQGGAPRKRGRKPGVRVAVS